MLCYCLQRSVSLLLRIYETFFLIVISGNVSKRKGNSPVSYNVDEFCLNALG